ncbi:MAG: hypothetical protein RSP_04780 [Rhodanobacter sp.]
MHEQLEPRVLISEGLKALELLINHSGHTVAVDIGDGETVQVNLHGIADDLGHRLGFAIRQAIAFGACFEGAGESG